MKNKNSILLVIVCTLFFACNSSQKETPKYVEEDVTVPEEKPVVNMVDRGELLVNAIGCHDCHTPKKFSEKGMELDTSKLLSGHWSDQPIPAYDTKTAKSFVLFSPDLTYSIGPWGTSFAANLTPDDTGIGTWSEAQFLNAIKNGKYKGLDGSRSLLPPMPWESYRNLPDEDLKAIFVYLKTIKPVENVVAPAIPPKQS